jgi:hypothetical protein
VLASEARRTRKGIVRKVTDRPHGVVVSDHQLLGRLPSSAVRACDQKAAGPLPGDEPGREAARLELGRKQRSHAGVAGRV